MRGGASWVSSREGGRKDGEGRIDSNPNNNKAIKGRPRPALRLSVSRRFLGHGSSWSIASCAETTGVGVSGGESGGRAGV